VGEHPQQGLAVQGSSSRCLSRFASRFAWTRGSSARLLGLFAESLGYIWFFDSFLVIIPGYGPHSTSLISCELGAQRRTSHTSLPSVHRQSHSTHGHAVMWLRDTFF